MAHTREQLEFWLESDHPAAKVWRAETNKVYLDKLRRDLEAMRQQEEASLEGVHDG